MKYGPHNFCSLAHLRIEDAELSNKMIGEKTTNLFPPMLLSLHLISCNLSDTLNISPDLFKLRTLEIRSCVKLKLLEGLHGLCSLSCLILWNCPLLTLQSETILEETYPEMLEKRQALNSLNKEDQETRRKREGNLPPLLESLVIHGCHSMLSLHMILDYPSLMTEVQITNCSRLMYIEGLRDLIGLEIMAFIDCPHLLLELLDNVPECVVISGCPQLKYWRALHAIEPLGNPFFISMR
jgi:hypothetical protein